MDSTTWERAQHFLEQAHSRLPWITERLHSLTQEVYSRPHGEDISPEEQEAMRREAERIRFQVLLLSGSLSYFTQALIPPKGP